MGCPSSSTISGGDARLCGGIPPRSPAGWPVFRQSTPNFLQCVMLLPARPANSLTVLQQFRRFQILRRWADRHPAADSDQNNPKRNSGRAATRQSLGQRATSGLGRPRADGPGRGQHGTQGQTASERLFQLHTNILIIRPNNQIDTGKEQIPDYSG